MIDNRITFVRLILRMIFNNIYSMKNGIELANIHVIKYEIKTLRRRRFQCGHPKPYPLVYT